MPQDNIPFDNWVEKKLNWVKESNLISEDWETAPDIKYKKRMNVEDMWGAPYFKKMMQVIENNGDIEEFIKNKNQDLHDQYFNATENNVEAITSEFKRQTGVLTASRNVNKLLDEFEKDIDMLRQKYPEDAYSIRKLLSSYEKNGKFEKGADYEEMTKPKSFLDKILSRKKRKEANQFLDTFIDKYENLNIGAALKEYKEKYGGDISDTFNSRFEAMIHRGGSYKNIEAPELSEKYSKEIAAVNNKISNLSEDLKRLSGKENSFANSTVISKEDKLIRSFAAEIREEIQNPKTLASKDYVENLDKLPDDEIIMFNIGLRENCYEHTKNILEHNGLKTGTETDQWLLREEKRKNSDEGRYELFSPLMTVKEAKEIMPKLMSELDRAHVSSGLAVPMKAADMFKNSDLAQTEISQDGLQKFIAGIEISERIQVNPYYTVSEQNEDMQKYGFSSKEELPKVFSSLDEIKKQYPKEQFLFSGSTASDDCCSLSGRVGRNGICYATPDIGYASKYDGVTNVGYGEDVKATGDKYVSSVIGKDGFSGEDIKIGFINIYAQSPDDKYFPNFGMEDYRQKAHSDEKPKTYDMFEPSYDGARILHRQGQTAANGRLTREQAINGYVGGTVPSKINGKEYMPFRYDSETYVTPDKNPIKEKLMHVKMGEKEWYIPVSGAQNKEVIQAILNKRQAKMEDTFEHSGRVDLISRFRKQEEEFKRGIIPQIRQHDVDKQQTNLSAKSENVQTSMIIKEKIAALKDKVGASQNHTETKKENSAVQSASMIIKMKEGGR